MISVISGALGQDAPAKVSEAYLTRQLIYVDIRAGLGRTSDATRGS